MKGMAEWAAGFPALAGPRPCGALLMDDPRPSEDADYPCQSLSTEELLRMEPHLSRQGQLGA